MSGNARPDWSRAFDDPIPLPDGRVLRTLHDAGHYAGLRHGPMMQQSTVHGYEMHFAGIRPPDRLSPIQPAEGRRHAGRPRG
jgi:hypothetical protein